jgi:hypothetical protein
MGKIYPKKQKTVENRDQYGLNSDIPANDSSLDSINDVHTAPAEGLNGVAVSSAQPALQEKGWGYYLSRMSWPVIAVVSVSVLIMGGIVWASVVRTQNQAKEAQQNSNNKNHTTLDLDELLNGKDLSLGDVSNVTINGTLQLGDDFLLTPSLQPTGAKRGQIYFDQNTNELAYYNGENFVFLTGPDQANGGIQSLGGATGQVTLGTGLSSEGNQISNSGVLSVQGQTGAVTFTAGAGMVINGNTFSNSGVLGVTSGSSNVTVANDGNGNVSISVDNSSAGTITSSGGNAGTIPLFTASQNIENSIITQSGLAVTIGGSLNLTNALSVTNGGIGANTLAANGVLVGQGTNAITSVTAGGSGLCLVSTAGAPAWGACSGGGGVTSLNGATGGLNIANATAGGSIITIDDATTSTKGIASFNSTNFSVSGGAVNTAQNIDATATPTFTGVNTNTITPGAALTVGVSAQTALLQGSTTTITSNGGGNNIVLNSAASIELQDNTNVTGNVTASGDLAVNGGDITSSGTLNITPGGALTIGASSQALTLQGGATSSFRATSGANTTIVGFTSPTANTTLNFPALAAGTYTVCTTSGNCSGAAATLQSAYDNSTNPEIVLDATRGAMTIRDNASALGANLLEVQSNDGSVTYLAVTASGTAVTGTATATGNINSTGGALQTNSTNRIDNSGNAVNLGNVTLSGTISGGTTITGSGNINSTGGALQTNGTTRVDNSGNLVNIVAVTASGSATFQGGTATLGTNAQAGSVVLNDGSSNTGTLQVAALGQNTVYTLPDPGAGSATICLSSGNCAGSGSGVTTVGGTTNRLAKFTGSQAVGDSTISDDGTNVTVSVDVIIQGGDLTVGTTSQNASIVMHDGNGQTTTLQAGDSTGNITFILPTSVGNANQCLKQSGTGNQLVWQDCDGGSGGSSATLQAAYDNSATPEITLDATRGALTLRDNSTPLGANLFEIQNNLGSTTYLAVTVSGLSVTGTSTATGNVNSSAGALQTNGTNRVDNSGNLVNIGNITGTGAVTIASVGAGNDITVNGADQFIVQDSSVFNALSTFNANIDLGANDLVGTTADIDLTNFDVTGATGNVTAGTYNGQTISSSANFTGTLAVASNTTLTGDIAVNGGDITSSGALNITPGGALTVGVSAQTALLQGSTTTITSNGAGNDILLNSADTIELQDNTNVTGSVTASGDIAVNGGDLTSTGALNITPGGTLTVGVSSQTLTLQGGATSSFRATSGANTTTVAFVSPTANTTLNFPALVAGTYTICTTSGNCSGAAATLQSSYDNSTSPEIVLDATRLGLTIRDNSTPVGGNLLEVQNNAGSTTYLAVTAAGAVITGTATATGNINSTSGTLQTNSTNRIDNSGNLVNIAAVTASGSATFQGGGLTLGTNAQAGSIVLNDGSSNTATLQVAALGQNTLYTLPDPGVGTATICLTTGNCAGSGSGVTTSGGTTNRIAKFSGSQAVDDSTISDDGTNVTVSVDVIIQGGDLTVGTTSQNASIVMHDGNGQTTTLQAGNSAGNMTFILPTNTGSTNQCLKQSGTGNQLVWQDCDGGLGGSSATLQASYDNSTNPEITLDATRGALTLRDNSTPIGANLFEIQNDLGSTTYLAVTVSGLSVTGTASATGNINTSGGALQTNSTSRIDNSGNLVNIGNITGTGAVTIASVGAGNDITINGADQFIVQDSSVFNALSTFNANIDLGTNDLVGTTADIDLTNFDVVGSTGNVTAGTYNGQTISNAANFTGSITSAGTINSTGGVIQTNSITRVDNTGNLTNIGNITGAGAITIASSGAGNDVIVNGADQFIVQDVAQFNAQANFDLGANGEVYITGTGSAANTRDYLIVDMVNNSTSGVQRGMLIQNAAGTGSTEGFIALDNVDTDTSVGYGIQITSSAAGITTALDVSDADIVTAMSFGANDLVGTTGNIDMTNFDVVGSTGAVTAGTYNGQTISSAASFTGTVTAATSLRAPLIDTATAAALAIGTTNATAINLNQNTTLGAGKTLTVTSANTSLTGATSGDALTVSNSTSTGNVAVFNDNSTAVFTIADSGIITAKSQGTSTTAFDIQNSSSQSLFAVDTFNNTAHLRTVGRDNTSTYEAIWLQGSKNGITTLIGGNDDTSAYVANDFSGSMRFNGSGVGWGDMAYFPQGGGNGNNGQFRFSTTGSALNTTPNAKLGVGDLYVAGNAGIGTNSPSYKLHVAGDVNVNSGSVYRINGTTICSGTTCTPASGSGSYIQNQSASQQSASSFWTSGSGRVDGGVLTNNVTSNSGALTLQAATNVISLGGSDTLTANGGFTINSGSNSSLTVNAAGSGALNLGNNATSGRVINIGATGSQANTSTTNIGTSTGAAQTINIGSTNGTGTTTISAGSGGVNINGATTVSGALSATSFSGAGLADCDSTNSKLLYDATTDLFSCGTDRASGFVRKSADESLTNNTTLQPDDQLTFTVVPGETYFFTMSINATFSSAGGMKYSVTGPTGSTCNISSHGMDTSGGAAEMVNVGCGTSATYGSSNTAYNTVINGSVVAGGGGGTSVTLNWSQNGLSGTATVVKAGSTLTVYRITGADLAEVYYSNDSSVSAGDVVQLDSSLQAGVKKTSRTYDSRALGIVSTRPGHILGDDLMASAEGTPVLLALSGRVPVKVSTENGPIEPGDFLTSSSTPGVAMKATEPGYAIAQAMTSFSGEGTGSVLGFIKGGWYEPPRVTGADLQNSTVGSGIIDSLRIEGPLTVTNDAVFQGKISVKDIEITGHVTVGKDTAGTAIIPAGQTYVDVTFENPYVAVPKVTATATGFVLVEVTNKTEEGFRINIPEAKAQDTSIDWISLQLKE